MQLIALQGKAHVFIRPYASHTLVWGFAPIILTAEVMIHDVIGQAQQAPFQLIYIYTRLRDLCRDQVCSVPSAARVLLGLGAPLIPLVKDLRCL